MAAVSAPSHCAGRGAGLGQAQPVVQRQPHQHPDRGGHDRGHAQGAAGQQPQPLAGGGLQLLKVGVVQALVAAAQEAGESKARTSLAGSRRQRLASPAAEVGY
jgi:hypothetical protein